MWSQLEAENYLNAYHILEENNKSVIDRLEKTQKSRVLLRAHQVRHISGVGVVCLAFSVELYMKDLHLTASGSYPKGHNILKLYKALPLETQTEVYMAYLKIEDGWTLQQFEKQIQAISNGYIKWRYFLEAATLRYNTGFALNFIKAVRRTSDLLRTRITT